MGETSPTPPTTPQPSPPAAAPATAAPSRRRRILEYALTPIFLVVISIGVYKGWNTAGSQSPSDDAVETITADVHMAAAAKAPTLLWRKPGTDVDRSYSTAVAGDLVLVSYRNSAGNDFLSAYSLGGEEQWFSMPRGLVGEIVLDGTRMYAAQNDGALSAIELKGFKPMWTATMPNAITPPAVNAEVAVFGEQQFLNAYVVATGKSRWRVDNAKGIVGPPALSADKVFISDDNGSLVAFDLKTGKQQTRGHVAAVLVSGPVLQGNMLYAATSRGVVAADAGTLAVKWAFEPGSDTGGNPTSGPGGGTGGPANQGMARYLIAAPVVEGGMIYQSFDHTLYALDAGTGKPKWKFLTADERDTAKPSDANVMIVHERVEGKEKATGRLMVNDPTQPKLSGGRLYIGTHAGIFAVDAATGKQLWFYSTPGPVSGPPAASDKVLSAPLGTNGTIALELH